MVSVQPGDVQIIFVFLLRTENKPVAACTLAGPATNMSVDFFEVIRSASSNTDEVLIRVVIGHTKLIFATWCIANFDRYDLRSVRMFRELDHFAVC